MFNSDNPKDLIESLCNEIERHNKLYYIDANPEVSDKVFDGLLRQLEELEHEYPHLISESSPTQRVGGEPINFFETINHTIPMQSLSNTYSKDELVKFDERVKKIIQKSECEYVIEPKIDGVAISIRYEKGKLIHAVTRGDGSVGDDVTKNIKTIKTIPLRLSSNNPPDILEIRGEIFLDRNEFDNLNQNRIEKGFEPFANPRNACAGSLKLLDSKEVSSRPLDAIFYNIGKSTASNIKTHFELIKYLKKFGIKISPFFKKNISFDSLLKNLDELKNQRDNFPFEIDGAVIKVNDRSLYQKLGNTSKSPRWAVAYKYESEQAVTKLKDITIQVGRTGVLTPVAELEPVQLAGTLVKRATLHNFDEIHRKDIRIGDHVLIEKAGEIIPIVIKVILNKRLENSKKFTLPKLICSECKEPVVKKKNEVAIRCINIKCPAKIKGWIEHFSSRKAMDISGLGKSMIDQLVSGNLVENPADLYDLKYEDILSLDRTAEKSAYNLIESIRLSKKTSFDRTIFALGIPNVGKTASEIIAKQYKSIENLMTAKAEELELQNDIGPIVAQSIVNYFSELNNKIIIDRLKKHGINFKYQNTNKDSEFEGLTFVITGILNSMSRQQASDLILAKNGKVGSSISRKTDYLIVGESAGSKLKKAQNLSVKILNESDFINFIN